MNVEGLGALAAMPILDLVDDKPPLRVKPKIAEIQSVVCAHFGLTIADLKGPSREPKFATPRQIAYVLCYEMTDNSYPGVAKHFGGRDHSTLVYANKKLREREATSVEFAQHMDMLRGKVEELTAKRVTAEVWREPVKTDAQWVSDMKRPDLSATGEWVEVAA